MNKGYKIDMNNITVVIMIPVDGCYSCVSKSLDFIKTHYDHPFHYILSSVSERNLKFISNQLPTKPENIFYDFENSLMMQGLVNQIPRVFIINKKKIIFSSELSTNKDYVELIKILNGNLITSIN